MEKTFQEALRHRRSYYHLADTSLVDDERIAEILRFAIEQIPSAFNSQSTRLVLLLHDHHRALWEIVRNTLRGLLSETAFARSTKKIERSFAAGYGTVLFFEDEAVLRQLRQEAPIYAASFTTWSAQTSAMHQLTVWTMLEEVGFGASLQHYNPLIDDDVRQHWGLPAEWTLMAQMPFGMPLDTPEPRSMEPVEERLRIFC